MTRSSKLKLVKYYIYAYTNTENPGTFSYNTSMGVFIFNNEPTYIGKGYYNMGESHQNNCHNEELKRHIATEQFEYDVIERDLPSHLAHRIETELIHLIGRKDLQRGPLFNRSAGVNLVDASDYMDIGPLNIEFNRLMWILEELNKNKTIKGAAEVLGISERTLHRNLKSYKLKKDRYTKLYYQELN